MEYTFLIIFRFCEVVLWKKKSWKNGSLKKNISIDETTISIVEK